MSRIDRLIQKAKKTKKDEMRPGQIAWATIRPMGDAWELMVMYYADPAAAKAGQDVFTFQTKQEAEDHVDALADKLGQDEVMVIHFNF